MSGPMICDECGLPFDGQTVHATVMDESAMRRWVLRCLAHEAITDAPTLDAAIAAAHRLHGETRHGGSAPHRPCFECRRTGVAWRREVLGDRQVIYRMDWREVALALRGVAEQLPLFAVAS